MLLQLILFAIILSDVMFRMSFMCTSLVERKKNIERILIQWSRAFRDQF